MTEGRSSIGHLNSGQLNFDGYKRLGEFQLGSQNRCVQNSGGNSLKVFSVYCIKPLE